MRNEMFSSYSHACRVLEQAGVPDAKTDAGILTETAYDVSLSKAFGYRGEFPGDAFDRLCGMLERRIKGEPLQYIIGSWDFMGYTFAVGEGVLIPRSETEVLVEQTVKRLKQYRLPTVYDLCAGSGCIGLSIKKMMPDARVFLFEKSTEALHWLNENRYALGLDHTTVAIKGDVTLGYETFSSLPAPDCIVSNPPYIASAEIDGLQKEVLMEPRMALDGGDDGLDFYRVLSEKWFPYINENGFMCVECGEQQADSICAMFPENAQKDVFADYCGVQRFIRVEKGINANDL